MRPVHPLYLPLPYQDSADSGRLILRDGTTAMIRAAGPGDRDGLRVFFAGLSPESRQRRFFSQGNPSATLIDSFCDSSDPRCKLTLIVTRMSAGTPRIIAAASYIARDQRTAEVAFAVDDAYHGKGIAALLLERLSLLAVNYGFLRFWAVTNLENRPMIQVFRNSGFQLHEEPYDGCVEIDFSVAPTEASVMRSEMRDRIFTAASLRPFFQPNAVAVVGASRKPSSIGYRLLKCLVENQFRGPVYAVNPNASAIDAHRSYPSVKDLPEPVDLALIAVPRDAVLQVVDDCAERNVRALVVITAGFAEIGAEGQELQQRLLEKVRGYGMRMAGPNCMGLLNTDPQFQLNASFSPVFPPRGRVAMSSQSGALGLAILALARQRQLGLSTFISVGNKADISGNDLLQYWEEDANTNAILLYLESFGNPRRFARIARRVARSKPIVAIKAGRTLAGGRASGSHTAALAASDVAVDALFRQTGVIRAETLDEMFDLAITLSNQPLPVGRRVAILTNAGGPGILCVDACEAGGASVPELSEEIKTRLRRFLPPAASLKNPVDMIASADAEHFRLAIETLLPANEIDALIVIFIPVGMVDLDRVRQAVCDGVASARKIGVEKKPVLACLMSEDAAKTQLICGREQIPTFAFPECAGQALAKAMAYAEWRRKPLGIIPDFEDSRPEAAREICQRAISKRGAGWLSTEETRAVLTSLGLPVCPGGVAATEESAALLARSIGFPVAVKLASHQIVHKTEIGAVHLNLRNEAAVRQAFQEIHDRLAKDRELGAMEGVLVQPMISRGVEVMVGVTVDSLFGPLIAFGLGGIHVEILRDVCFRITPLTDADAGEMIRGIRGYRLLEGYRGHPAADIAAIEEVLLRVSRLVEELPEISEIDLNPVFALSPGEGCRIVDARIRVELPGKEDRAG